MRFSIHFLVVLACLATLIARGQTGGAATMTVQVNQPGAVVSSNLFGIFFEEISSAGDGGLYAELVRNRSFEDNPTNADYWTLTTSGTAVGSMHLDRSLPLSASNRTSLRLSLTNGTGAVGAANSGYWGIPIQAGKSYHLGFYARCSAGFQSSIVASLENSDGSIVYVASAVTGLSTNWQHFTLTLVPGATDPAARLVLRIFQPGTVWLDFVSLFPPQTFKNRPNGLRPDLANMLLALKPSFVRFPGGAWVDGSGVSDFYNWETTIGDPANRTPRWDLWGYMVDNGLGYEEYLQMCEDLGATPLFVVNCGMDYSTAVPTNQLQPYIQEALDAIQYANGSTNTPWGAQRAANGHPAPFHLRYMEIGNENGGAAYNTHYAMFYDAIKSRYPYMQLIANSPVTSRPMDILDEHFYPSTTWFVQNAGYYDHYSRSGPKIFVGEYAAISGAGNGNLAGAISEAAWMTGLERNSDVVKFASYAPLFANLNNKDWNPDLIYFNGTQAYGQPSYYVQQMFSLNRGDMVLPTTINETAPPPSAAPHGAIGLGSWNTSVQYTNITVTSNGVELYHSDFANQGTNGWRVFNGAWSANAGVYQQTNITTDCYSTTGNTNWANYTITLQARKVGGAEGFLILFNFLDDNNWTWWNIGGWGNALDGIEQMSGGNKHLISSQIPESIQSNQWYDLRIVLTGPRIQCYLNGKLVQDVNTTSALLASTTYAKSSHQVIVKAVNAYNSPVTTTFHLMGVDSIAPNATVIQLTSTNPTDENSLADPTKVFPVTNAIANAGTNFSLTLPANSLSILRLTASGINNYTNLQLQVPSPITNDAAVTAIVSGEQSGNWIDLTTNTRHAITWSSADTNVAVVDINGKVTGVGSGTTTITASYPALGLSATQAVQVIHVSPPPLTLVHRYSFNDAPGNSTVADSVGGSAWNGILPNGGTLGNGQLALSSASQQYVQLPANILANYPAVTIESWVTFPDQLPVNCFFYGFGNTDTSGAGDNYIFCAPQAGRIAITAADPGYTGEQNAVGAGDLSYHTNLHVVAVYNPPAGSLTLYTNGLEVASNQAITVPMSSVTDVLNYIGRSLYNVDPYPDMELNEFRIYDGAMTASEVAATQVLGPNQLLTTNATTMGAAVAGNQLTLSWPLAAAGFLLESRTNLSVGMWQPVTTPAPQIIGNQWQIKLPTSGNTEFFRLKR